MMFTNTFVLLQIQWRIQSSDILNSFEYFSYTLFTHYLCIISHFTSGHLVNGVFRISPSAKKKPSSLLSMDGSCICQATPNNRYVIYIYQFTFPPWGINSILITFQTLLFRKINRNFLLSHEYRLNFNQRICGNKLEFANAILIVIFFSPIICWISIVILMSVIRLG